MEFQAVHCSRCSSQSSFPHLPSSSQAFTIAVPSPSSSRRGLPLHGGGKRSALQWSRSWNGRISKSRSQIITSALTASFNPFSDEDSLHKQWQGGLMQAGETAYCSVKKAFSSTVFIILELHSFALQMREFLYYEDLQGILAVVQKEIHASFVWLFQKVFSHTPTLMVYVMILLANYGVYSMSTRVAASPVQVQQVSAVEDQKNADQGMDSSTVPKARFSSSSGKTMSIGGGDGGKYRPVASDTDGDDDRFNESNDCHTIVPNESVSFSEEESRDGADHETVKGLVPAINIKIETRDYSTEHFRTEMQYLMELAQEPNNSLLLANFAQFLYLVAKDFDRAEEYFKRATAIEPKDAEALNKYANFLWKVKNELCAAEETFLEAIDMEPQNPFYPAEYAHFLWNTGGEDTCFPLT